MRVCIILLLVIMFNPVLAQDSTSTGFVPQLNGHRFLDAATQNTPFTNTVMSIKTGFASTEDIVFPISLGQDTTLFGIDGSLLFIQGNFFYQQKIKEWLAVYLNVAFHVRTGNDVTSLALDGINTLSKFELGWKFKLIRSQKFMWSANFMVTNNEAVFINVSEWVKNLGANQPTVSISNKVPALQTSISTSAAWGINPTLGLFGDLKIGFGETLNRGNNNIIHTSEIGVEIDLLPRTKVPLGFRGKFVSSTLPELIWTSTKGASEVYELAMVYTQSNDFRISINSYLSTTPVNDYKANTRFYGFYINLQYYFN